MITCPWCGTHYTIFQPNCSNCGGPLLFATGEASAVEESVPMPPPPPRPISDNYVWRLLQADAGTIAALVFLLLGAIFTVVGVVLTVAIVTAFVGIPFAGLGILFLLAGGAVGVQRYQAAMRIVEVLRTGAAAEGQIVRVEENYRVRVGQRHPWTITYQFRVAGQDYQGQVTSLTLPGSRLQPGKKARMLYLPNAPEHNALYPHP